MVNLSNKGLQKLRLRFKMEINYLDQSTNQVDICKSRKENHLHSLLLVHLEITIHLFIPGGIKLIFNHNDVLIEIMSCL